MLIVEGFLGLLRCMLLGRAHAASGQPARHFVEQSAVNQQVVIIVVAVGRCLLKLVTQFSIIIIVVKIFNFRKIEDLASSAHR